MNSKVPKLGGFCLYPWFFIWTCLYFLFLFFTIYEPTKNFPIFVNPCRGVLFSTNEAMMFPVNSIVGPIWPWGTPCFAAMFFSWVVWCHTTTGETLSNDLSYSMSISEINGHSMYKCFGGQWPKAPWKEIKLEALYVKVLHLIWGCKSF